MEQSEINNSPGILGFMGLMFIAFKITGEITWPWWAVLAPFYVPAAAAFLTGLIIGYINVRRKQSSTSL